MQTTLILKNIKGFDWDPGNIVKSETKHNVKWFECEQIFFNKPLLLLDDKNIQRPKRGILFTGKPMKEGC